MIPSFLLSAFALHRKAFSLPRTRAYSFLRSAAFGPNKVYFGLPNVQEIKKAAFRLGSSKWRKGDEVVSGGERRTFTFLAESKEAADLWLYMIRCRVVSARQLSSARIGR